MNLRVKVSEASKREEELPETASMTGGGCQHEAKTVVRKMELCRKWKEAHSEECGVGLHY